MCCHIVDIGRSTAGALLLFSCGAMTHKTKDCVDRPRKVGARWSNKHIAADEKVESIDMKGFEAKRDRWTGYDSKEYSRVIDTCASCFSGTMPAHPDTSQVRQAADPTACHTWFGL